MGQAAILNPLRSTRMGNSLIGLLTSGEQTSIVQAPALVPSEAPPVTLM